MSRWVGGCVGVACRIPELPTSHRCSVGLHQRRGVAHMPRWVGGWKWHLYINVKAGRFSAAPAVAVARNLSDRKALNNQASEGPAGRVASAPVPRERGWWDVCHPHGDTRASHILQPTPVCASPSTAHTCVRCSQPFMAGGQLISAGSQLRVYALGALF